MEVIAKARKVYHVFDDPCYGPAVYWFMIIVIIVMTIGGAVAGKTH